MAETHSADRSAFWCLQLHGAMWSWGENKAESLAEASVSNICTYWRSLNHLKLVVFAWLVFILFLKWTVFSIRLRLYVTLNALVTLHVGVTGNSGDLLIIKRGSSRGHDLFPKKHLFVVPHLHFEQDHIGNLKGVTWLCISVVERSMPPGGVFVCEKEKRERQGGALSLTPRTISTKTYRLPIHPPSSEAAERTNTCNLIFVSPPRRVVLRCIPRLLPALRWVDYGHNPRGAKVEPPRVSRIGALLQGLGCAPGTSRFLPGFGSEQESSAAPGRRNRRTQSTRSRMPVMRGLLAPQNTFLDTIATRFDGTRE